MFSFFLWSTGSLTVLSMVINYILDMHYVHPKLIRLNQVLMFIVAMISAYTAIVYRANKEFFCVGILLFIVTYIKSFLYGRLYTKIVENFIKAQKEQEEENEDENEED